MSPREPSRAAEEGERPTELEGLLRALAGIFALQDMLLLAYLGLTGLMVWSAAPGPVQAHCARVIYVSIAAHSIGCFLARGRPRLPVLLRAAIYRCSIVGVLVSSYLTLRDTLTLVRPDSVDDVLVRIDLRLFGVEPALWLERFNQRPIVEWFSFFYFSYFFICTAYMVTIVWLTPPARRTTEFAVGTLLVYTVGQIGYTAVPGYGPVAHLKDQFHGGIAGGFFWSCVWSTVQAGGAMKDIFPSLHTAGPSWFTLYALHQSRSDPRWRWPARITGFFAVNIIISTMLLRWHYGIDVVAGLSLAVTAGILAPRLAAMEESWRQSMGFPGPWTFLPGE